MRIVIDPRPVFKNGFSVEDRRYISACLGMLVKEKPQTDFCLLTDRKSMAGELLAVGATVIPLPSASSIFPGSRFLAIRNLSKTILGQKADALFTIGTPAVMDFGLPECSWLFGSNLPPFKKHAQYQSVKSWLFTGSPDQKPMLLEKGLASHEKIQPVPLAAEDSPSTLTWTEKENLKVKYAGGREYFITRSYFSEENLMLVLKAFSLFKKKQQSNMQLLITGMKGDVHAASFEKLDTYKFRNDVHVYASLDANSFYQTTAAAYALIQPGDAGTCIGMLNALQAQVPVIALDDGKIRETCENSVSYAAADDFESFSEQMSLVFKDEMLRGDLIRKGKIQAQKFTVQQSISAIWNGLMRALPTKTSRDS